MSDAAAAGASGGKAQQNLHQPCNILVTGGAGFIASAVVRHLCKEYASYKVVVMDKLDYCANIRNLEEVKSHGNFKFVKGDVTSVDLVSYVMESEDIDTVLHFAAQTHVDNSFGNSFAFTENNVVGTHVMLEAAKVRMPKLKRFVHVSTDEVYGENKEGSDEASFTEHSSTLDPTNPYSATKACAEMLTKAYSQSYGVPIIVTRGNNVYGPCQYPEKLIPKFLTLASMGRPLPVHGGGGQCRSYLYVDDVARAFDVVMHKGVVGEIYNIGTQVERSVIDVGTDICKLFDLDPKTTMTHVSDRLFNDQRYFVDDSKLVALGWKQLISWENGLRMTYDWYSKHEGYWPDVELALRAHPSMGPAAFPPPSPVRKDKPAVEEEEASVVEPKAAAAGMEDMRVLIYGRTGWLGGLMGDICEAKGVTYKFGTARLQDRRGVEEDIKSFKPTHVLNAAGVTGRPNVDWCESNRKATLRANVIGTLGLADVCSEMGVHMTNFATGCIFEYDEGHQLGSGVGFKEEDKPNFAASYYSKTKAIVEDLMEAYDNVLTLRVRMPISEDLKHPRNFITKIARYEFVVDVPNSMTILPEMMPMALTMAQRRLTGVYNFTNPGTVSHNEILQMYKEYYKPDFTWKNFSLEDQAKILAAGRSNNELDCTKLKSEFPDLLPIKESLVKYVFGVQKKQAVASDKVATGV